MDPDDQPRDDEVITRRERLDRLISAWHAGADSQALHEYLGWTEDEYKHWVRTSQLPPEREDAA